MTEMKWDTVGTRNFENGLDRGVLYLPDGSGVPWSGLTSVIEKIDQTLVPIYYDGQKVNDFVTLGSFEASMKAVTYPEEFVDFEGVPNVKRGIRIADQPAMPFGLAYRTMKGNDLDGHDASYRIHLIYNVTAIPSDKNHASLSDNPEITEFEWSLTAIPNEIGGFRPTAHLIFESDDIDPWLLNDIEKILYGSADQDAALIPIDDLIEYIEGWFRLKITDHGDGTWSATEYIDGTAITMETVDRFRIDGANAIYLDDVTFRISDTTDITEVPSIRIIDLYDGRWQATTEHDGLIIIDETDQSFEIRNAEVIWIDEYTYQISDTIA